MPKMSGARLHAFLSQGPWIAKIATISPQGRPYVNPVWYEYDGQAVYVAGRERARWVINIRQNPWVAVLIDSPELPYARVIIEAEAEILSATGYDAERRLKKFVRYLGEEMTRRYLAESEDRPRVIVRIPLTGLTTWEGLDWHPRYLW